MDSEAARRILCECEAKHKALAEKMADIGFIHQGSVVKRYMQCGRSSCACHKDPASRHGPYYYWSTKVGGKSVAKMITSQQAELLGRWVKNRNEMDAIVTQMKEISRVAFDAALFLIDEEKDDSSSKKSQE